MRPNPELPAEKVFRHRSDYSNYFRFKKEKVEPRWFSWLPFNPANLFNRGYENGNFLRFCLSGVKNSKCQHARNGHFPFYGHFHVDVKQF